MAEVTTEDQIPSYQENKFFEWNPGEKEKLDAGIASLQKKSNAFGGPGYKFNTDGFGNVSLNELIALRDRTPEQIEASGQGRRLSYEDLALEALQGDPNFDPEDTSFVSSFAQDLEKRGLKNSDRDKISSLATNQSIKNQIDRAVNPGKYLDEGKKADNQANAQRLSEQFGQNDPDTVDFITRLLDSGDSPFEVSEFLQTTPQFQERKAAKENERVKTESAAARESLNQELLKSQQEVFQRAQPSIISSYMKAGRLNSSGLENALTQAQADLERERQGFLANAGYNDAIRAQGYGREDFVRNNAQAFNSYLRQNEPAYQQKFAVNQAQNFANFQQPYNNLARQYQLSDETRQRGYQLEDYNSQKSDFNRYLDQYRSQGRENAMYGLLGSVAGAGMYGLLGSVVGAGAKA